MQDPCAQCDQIGERNSFLSQYQDHLPEILGDSPLSQPVTPSLHEGRLKLLADATFEGICVHDHGVILDVNHQFSEMFGYTDDELKGMDCFGLIAPESQNAVRESISSGFQGPYESWGLRKDGSTFPVEVRIREFQQDEKVLRFAIFRDLTLLKQAEAALMMSLEKFKRLSEATFEGIVIHEQGNFVESNQQFADMFGYSIDELKGLDGSGLFAPESREIVREKIASGDKGAYEAMCLRKNGSTFPAEIRARDIRLGEKSLRIATVRDRTGQKNMQLKVTESEAKYRELYDHSPLALYRTRIRDGALLECNQALVELFGYDSKEDFQATSKATDRYVDINDRTALLDQLRKDGRVDGFQVLNKRKNGELVWIEAKARVFPERGFIEGAMWDITIAKLLSKTEIKVLRQIMQGKSNKRIAFELERSIRTVEDHRANIMHKLGVDNIVALTQKTSNFYTCKR